MLKEIGCNTNRFWDERIAENQILFQKYGGKVHTNGYGVRVFWKCMIEFLG